MRPEIMSWTGQSVERVEDAALLTGRGRFIDDLGGRPGTLHAAFLRSPHAHAHIVSINSAAAAAMPGVAAIITGLDLARLTTPMVAGLKVAVENWPMAVERVRYVGEPVVIVVAQDRYLAEDALDAIEIDYAPLACVVDPIASLASDAPVLHENAGANLVSDRRFRYGDPEAAFGAAAHSVEVSITYPRNTGAPMETFGVVAEYDPHEDAYDILANFQGPFSIHAVMARCLKVSGNRLRLRMPPESGGSFGVKQGVAPYAVMIGVAARVAGAPVKWIEDRLEHLSAAVAATNRVTTLKAAVTKEGRITALDWDQVEDCGAYPRAPEPATLYRMHGNMTGAYDIRNLAIRNRVVLTNKAPTGLVRGFGGPQVYYALERLMQRIAVELELDPMAVIRANLIQGGAFPYRTASGAFYDSGDYAKAVDVAVADGRLASLERRRDEARAAGRRYGIGFAAAVEPSVSNMGYITTVLTAEERKKAGPKNGAQATATVSLDPVGSVSVHVASVPQGQGHRTSWRRSWPMSSACLPQRSRSLQISIQARTPGRSRRAIIRAASQPLSPVQRIWLQRGCATSWPPSPQVSSTSRPVRSALPAVPSSRRATGPRRCPSVVSPRSPTGRRRFCPTASTKRSAKPPFGHLRSLPPRPRATRSIPRSAMALSSTWPESRSTSKRARSGSTAMSQCMTAAAYSIPRWWKGRSGEASLRRSARASTKSSPTPMMALF